MINADLAFKAAKRKEDIYMYAAYFKPGKHSIMVSSAGEQTLQSFLVGVRTESVPHFIKEKGTKITKGRVFLKEQSVFNPWRKDDPNMLEQMLNENDFVKWKVNKFVK